MKIAVLLPYKENYSKNDTGAVSIFVNGINKLSKFKNNITIYMFDNTIMISCNKYFISGFILFLIVIFIRYYQNKIYIFS